MDCRGHLLGRVASHVVKELLNGQNVVLVRCEELNISGSLYRNKLNFEKFLRLRCNVNPRDGPFHYRSPAKIIGRVMRGMLKHKTARGQNALKRFQGFDGCPHPFDKMKKVVIPGALTNLRLKTNRKFCRLGDLATLAGWKHNDLILKLEEKRKVKASAYYNTKKQLNNLKTKAVENASKSLGKVNAQLATLGY